MASPNQSQTVENETKNRTLHEARVARARPVVEAFIQKVKETFALAGTEERPAVEESSSTKPNEEMEPDELKLGDLKIK
ncbi:hypothetical protein WN944_008302 [Citrus x changshan-huyou]|uniref:Uncharacterized protein n=1 Tax=Citrus x changshan-huyou TaxID=2935761 RepID=A0AAP0MQ46_9ROSI